MIRNSSMIFLMCFAQILCAQSFKDRILSMQSEYKKMERAHIKMEVNVFLNENTKQPYFKEVADVKRQYENYHTEFGSTKMLVNKNFIIMVNKASSEVVCTRRSGEELNNFVNDPFNASLDSILSFYGDPVFLGNKNDQEHYKLNQKSGNIKQIDLYINSKTNLLSKLEYRYDDGHFVSTIFTLMDTNPVFATAVFDEKQYIVLDKGKFSVSPAYKGYRLTIADSEEK